MRYRLAFAVVVLQVFVLAYMGGEREWILRTGRMIHLRTAPIDPNDPMRGEYIRLNYDISAVPKALWKDELLKDKPRPYLVDNRSLDLRVYAELIINETGIAELVSLSDRPPADGLYLRGRVNYYGGNLMTVDYGIEAMFMEQGKAQLLETMQRTGRPGVPLDMEVAVGSSGLAVLKGYKWEALGITLDIERPPELQFGAPRSTPPLPLLTVWKVELKNYGPEDVAIVDLPDGGSFRLVADNGMGQEIRFRWVGENQPAPRPGTGQVIVLKPGQSHVTKIDFAQSRWFVTDAKAPPDKAQPMALRDVRDTWAVSFRMVYVSPSKEDSAGLPHADIIQHGWLRSRIFSPIGRGRD